MYSEAKRVMAFKAVCDAQPADAISQLGQLMDDSHASCRDMYECSHPDLDMLVEICKLVLLVMCVFPFSIYPLSLRKTMSGMSVNLMASNILNDSLRYLKILNDLNKCV